MGRGKFKIGDIVTLKSGSPNMTVNSIGSLSIDEPDIQCTWFMGNKNMSGNFDENALELAKADE